MIVGLEVSKRDVQHQWNLAEQNRSVTQTEMQQLYLLGEILVLNECLWRESSAYIVALPVDDQKQREAERSFTISVSFDG